jgi:ribosomal protein L27
VAGRSSRERRDRAPHFSGEKVRGGDIILRTRAERLIFIAGLVAAVIIALLLWWR